MSAFWSQFCIEKSRWERESCPLSGIEKRPPLGDYVSIKVMLDTIRNTTVVRCREAVLFSEGPLSEARLYMVACIAVVILSPMAVAPWRGEHASSPSVSPTELSGTLDKGGPVSKQSTCERTCMPWFGSETHQWHLKSRHSSLLVLVDPRSLLVVAGASGKRSEAWLSLRQ